MKRVATLHAKALGPKQAASTTHIHNTIQPKIFVAIVPEGDGSKYVLKPQLLNSAIALISSCGSVERAVYN